MPSLMISPRSFTTSMVTKSTQQPGPYSFIEFDTYIQKAKKTYSDNRGRRNLNNLNTELQDVQRIMVQNIDDVLQRGAVLSEMENKSQNLTEMSRKYRKDAESLNATSLAVIAGACGGGFLLLLLIYFWVL